MSKSAPTLAEFLAGFEILVPDENGDYLLGWTYVRSVRRFQFRDPRNDNFVFSTHQYSECQAEGVYKAITPKSKDSV